ncbi:MAG: RNA polymerase subunit sigma-24 [Phototrophicales bacterium]|nr:MAG: RNA polymerase subunit sigma-24 [Phototrophicales bacterium]
MANENEFLSAAQHGDVHAFNQLVLLYQDTVYSVAYRILQEPHLAADATQNAFISAYQHIDQFKGGNFKAWLLRIVTNQCYDELRRQKRHPNNSLDSMLEDNDRDSLPFEADSHHQLDIMGRFDDPEQALLRQELQNAIEECLRKLAEGYRIIAILVDVEGMSYEEAASISAISLGTVKSRLSRARARLRDCLQQYQELLPAQFRFTDTNDDTSSA